MPRLKRSKSRFTPRKLSKGGGRWPVKPTPSPSVPVTEKCENETEVPLQLEKIDTKIEEIVQENLKDDSEKKSDLEGDVVRLVESNVEEVGQPNAVEEIVEANADGGDEGDVEDDDVELEVESRLPMMFCVVCYNEFTYYSLNCTSWETAMTKDFYVALKIPTEGQDDDSIISLPFCPECHSKVSVMFSVHQQLQSILQSFNCARNDLAFTIVETIEKNCRNGPLDLIRQQIFERWKDLHKSAKEKQSVDVFQETREEYLDPALTLVNDWPANQKSMTLSTAMKKRTPLQRKGLEYVNLQNTDTKNEDSPVSSYKIRRASFKKTFKIAPVKSRVSAKKVFKAKEKKGRVSEMPKLVPMEKLPSKSKPVTSSFRKTLNARKVNGTSYGNKRVPSKSALLKQSLSKGKLQLLKKQAGSTKSMSLLKTLGNKRGKSSKKKSALQLADGTWKCPYCPKTYPDLTRIRRHESLSHPLTRPLICHMCPKGFSTALTLRRHLQMVHHQAIEGFAKCPYCEKSFGKKYAFDLHIRSLHKGKSIPDYDCATPVGPSISVKVPMVSPPSPEITDLESPQANNILENTSIYSKRRSLPSLKRKSSMEQKIPRKREKTEVPIKVEANGSHDSKYEEAKSSESLVLTESLSSSNMNELVGKVDSKSITSYSCLICKIDFLTEPLLKNHMQSHEVSNKCMACDVEFSTESELRDHRLELHGKGGATCPICGKWYPKHQSLGGHMHLHRREGITWEKTGGGAKNRKTIAGLTPA